MFDLRSRRWTVSSTKESSAAGHGWNLYVVDTVPPFTLYQEMVTLICPNCVLRNCWWWIWKSKQIQICCVWFVCLSGWVQSALCRDQPTGPESATPPQRSSPPPACCSTTRIRRATDGPRWPSRSQDRSTSAGGGAEGELCPAGRQFQQVTHNQHSVLIITFYGFLNVFSQWDFTLLDTFTFSFCIFWLFY